MGLNILDADNNYHPLTSQFFTHTNENVTLDINKMVQFNLLENHSDSLDTRINDSVNKILRFSEKIETRYLEQVTHALNNGVYDPNFDIINRPLLTDFHSYKPCDSKSPLNWGFYFSEYGKGNISDITERMLLMHVHDFWVPIYGTDDFDHVEYRDFNRTLIAYFPDDRSDQLLIMQLDRKLLGGKDSETSQKYIFSFKNGIKAKQRCEQIHHDIIFPFMHYIEEQYKFSEKNLAQLLKTDIEALKECYRCQTPYDQVPKKREEVRINWIIKNAKEYKEHLDKYLKKHHNHTLINEVMGLCFSS